MFRRLVAASVLVAVGVLAYWHLVYRAGAAEPVGPMIVTTAEETTLAKMTLAPGAAVQALPASEGEAGPVFDPLPMASRTKLDAALLHLATGGARFVAGTGSTPPVAVKPSAPREGERSPQDRRDPPEAAAQIANRGRLRERPAIGDHVASAPRRRTDPVRVLVATTDLAAAQAAGLVVRSHFGGFAVGTVAAGRLDDLAGLTSVSRIASPRRWSAKNDLGRQDAGVPRAAAELGADGEGVIVAVIDSGLDLSHPAFRNPDGSTRVRAVLDLAFPGDVDGDGILDGPVGGGTVWTAAQIDAALAQGPGRTFRGSPAFVEPGDSLGARVNVNHTAPVNSVHLHVHLQAPLWTVQVALRAPDGATYGIDLSAATADELQATYIVPVPRGSRVNGNWELVVLNVGSEDALLMSWALMLDRSVFQEDLNGHGTHVTGSAAGNGRAHSGASQYTGIAPRSDIVFVRGERTLQYFATDDIVFGMQWVDATADALRQPYALNMSLGGDLGPHDGTEVEDKALDAIFGAGRRGKVAVVANGNSGDEAMHASGVLSPGGTGIPLAIVKAPDQDGVGSAWTYLVVEGIGTPGFGITHPHPSDLACATFAIAASGDFVDPLDDCGTLGRLQPGSTIGFALFDADDVMATWGTVAWTRLDLGHEIYIEWYDTEDYWVISGAWSVAVRGLTGRWDGWTPGCMPLVNCDTRMTVGSPASANNAIGVGAHNTRSRWTDQRRRNHDTGEVVGTLASFSSRGPTRDGRMRPDVSAPGQKIISARSAAETACPYVHLIYCIEPGLIEEDHVDGSHAASQGTSMASPMVAGAVALMLQMAPELDTQAVRAILHATAREDAHTGAPPSAEEWGAGKLDVHAAVLAAAELAERPPDEPDRVSIGGLTFIAETDDVEFTAQPIGVGTFEDPIVLYETISGPEPRIRIEGLETLGNVAGYMPDDPEFRNNRFSSFWLKKVVHNATTEACHWFDHEIRAVRESPSDEFDGLSFGQGDSRIRPWTSNRFDRVIEETEARDFINFSAGSLDPDDSGWFKYTITQNWGSVAANATSRQQAFPVWLVQRCNRVPVTPEPTAPPTARPPMPGTIFLPVAIKDPGCPPQDLFSDVVLVIDASTSMLEVLPGGRAKYELAVEAARLFVDGMRLNAAGPSDQIALVTFHGTSQTLSPLTPSRSALHAALDAFTAIQQGSRVELGLSTALVNLIGPEHRRENRRVVVLLSDGQANPVPGEEAVRHAVGIRAAGVVIYAVGIGPSIDEEVMLAIATDRERYFFVPSPFELARVFQELAAEKIPCAKEVYWP